MARARCPRSSVEAGQKCSQIKGEKQRATCFSPSEYRCLPASTLKPEEREFVVDPGASMHMISKKDLSDAEMDTLTKSCSPTIVITANGEQYGKLCSYRGSRLVKFVLWIFINFTDIHEIGESFFFISFILTFFTYSRRNSGSRKGRCT